MIEKYMTLFVAPNHNKNIIFLQVCLHLHKTQTTCENNIYYWVNQAKTIENEIGNIIILSQTNEQTRKD
jgi:hypothetical protein